MRKKEFKTLDETIEYIDSMIKYAECIRTHLVACQQIEWERDVAMHQLEEHGIAFGAKKE